MVLCHDVEWHYLEHFSLKFVVGLIDVQGLVFVWNVMIIGGLVHYAEVPVEGYPNSVLLRSIFYFQSSQSLYADK